MQIIRMISFCVLTLCFAVLQAGADTVTVDLKTLTGISKLADNVYFEAVCAQNTHDGKTKFCEMEPFKKTQVQMYQATGLAEEYILLKHGKSAVCSPVYRNVKGMGVNGYSFYDYSNDDYIKCTTLYNAKKFEFRFDDVEQSTCDGEIRSSIFKALASMNGIDITKKGIYPDTSCRDVPEQLCINTDKSMQKFGYNAVYEHTRVVPDYDSNQEGATKIVAVKHCIASFNSKKESDLSPMPFNMDRREFTTWQMHAVGELQMLLRRYAEISLKKQGLKLRSFRCDKGFTELMIPDGLHYAKDDIVTCWINGKKAEFVFDDLSETQDALHAGAMDGFKCLVDLGGTFDGVNCFALSKKQCESAEKELSKIGTITYHDKTGLCSIKMNNAANAEEVNKTNKRLAQTGATLGFMIIGVATGGSGWVVGATLIGGTLAVGGQKMEQDAEDERIQTIRRWEYAIQDCNNTGCAKAYLKDVLSTLQYYSDGVSQNLAYALDSLTASLINKIDDKNFYEKLAEKTNKSFEARANQAVQTTGQLFEILGDAISLFGPGASKFVVKSPAKLASMPKTMSAIFGNMKAVKVSPKLLNIAGKTTDVASWMQAVFNYAPTLNKV